MSKLRDVCIKGHYGSWYEIDRKTWEDGRDLALLEHEEFGDEAECLIVEIKPDGDIELVLDDVWNGWDDFIDHEIMRKWELENPVETQLREATYKDAIDWFYAQMESGLIQDDRQQEIFEIAIECIEKVGELK